MKLFKKLQTRDSTKEALSAPAKAEPKPSAKAGETAARKGKILVVDDDLVVVQAMTLKLQASGYDVLSATDGASAVSLVRHENPDLVVLDVNFPPEPGMNWDGFKIMGWFQRPLEGGKIPVIVISGEDSARNKERASEVGAVAFFQKPINTEALLTTLRKILP